MLQATLALAYLSLPEFRARVRRVQDVRYARTPVTSVSEEARNVAALLTRCRLPARGAPALRNEVVQLSYRTTLAANDQLRRSLPAAERTLAYLHIDLLALYLTAPDIRAMIDTRHRGPRAEITDHREGGARSSAPLLSELPAKLIYTSADNSVTTGTGSGDHTPNWGKSAAAASSLFLNAGL